MITRTHSSLNLGQHRLFLPLWVLATAFTAWLVLAGYHTFESPWTPWLLLGLLALTLTFIRWLPRPVLSAPPATPPTSRRRFVLLLIAVAIVLFILATLVGPALLFALPVIALSVLAVLRPRLEWARILYVLGLALVAGAAGLGAGFVQDFSLAAWAALQVALVLSGLLAGWAILARTDWLQDRLTTPSLGPSLFLTQGAGPALRGFLLGLVLSTPWALALVVRGSAHEDAWVQSWWQPVVAIQPGIAEEAWGRVLLVPLLFLVLRRAARARTALNAALILMAYWFAYLHTVRDLSPGALISTLMIGTLYALPVSYLWLRRGLEPAIGFHFWQDFVRFTAAYLMNQGLWFVS